MSAPRGRFVTVEGIDGAGKSTLLPELCMHLRERGIPVRQTREPGGTALGERIRGILLAGDGVSIGPEAETLLVFAARAQHLAEVVSPALAAGTWVVCDRFTDATFAYQGGGRGVVMERIGILRDWVHRELLPDLTLLLDVPVEVARVRRVVRLGSEDRIENASRDFLRRVRDAYLAAARSEPGRIRVIDATRDPDAVRTDALRALAAFADAQRR